MPRVRVDITERRGDATGESGGADIRIDTGVFRALTAARPRPRPDTAPTISRWFDCWRSRLRD